MVTKNPKISVYVPDDLKAKLLEKKEELRSNSISAVVVTILEEYFGITTAQSNAVSNAWVEQVNTRLTELESQLSQLSSNTEQDCEGEDQANDTKTLQLQLQETITQSNAIVAQYDSETKVSQSNAEATQQKENKVTQGNADTTPDDDKWIIPMSEVTALTGIDRRKIEKARKKNKLPFVHDGWQISFAGTREIRGRTMNTWEVVRLA